MRVLYSAFVKNPCNNERWLQNPKSTDWYPFPLPDFVVGSVQIYACTDVQNNLAELRFLCDPDNEGDAQCYDEAGPANVGALAIHVSTERVRPPPSCCCFFG